MRYLLFLLALPVTAAADATLADLQAVTVLVRAGNGTGSGVVFVNGTRSFVWTNAHVVEGLREVATKIDPKTGSPRAVVRYKAPQIVTEIRQKDASVGQVVRRCAVLRYNATEDLALLAVQEDGAFTASARFLGRDVRVEEGAAVWHVGSPAGVVGIGSSLPGTFVRAGRRFADVDYDQAAVPGAFYGSSGGPMLSPLGRDLFGPGDAVPRVERLRAIARQLPDGARAAAAFVRDPGRRRVRRGRFPGGSVGPRGDPGGRRALRLACRLPREGPVKLAALCCTYKRPRLLEELLECWRRQTYPAADRFLVVLDDAGQYENAAGDNWCVVSVPRRFATLGEKRNACAGLAPADAEGYLVADDDDLYLPHWCETQAEALRRGDWSRPSLVIVDDPGGWREGRTDGLYHGGMAFRRDIFQQVGGYRAFLSNGEDQELFGRLQAAGARVVDPCEWAPTFYVYRNNSGSYHLSWLGGVHDGYRNLGRGDAAKETLTPGWREDYTARPVERLNPPPVEVVAGEKRPVELVGLQNRGGRDGPSQGMYALQKALIARNLPWLSVRRCPPRPGALAWFWNYQDRDALVRWDRAGHPSVVGPNAVFMYSGSPGGHDLERRVLGCEHVRGWVCHSAWYADLLRKHVRPPANVYPIPYPIADWPDEPAEAEYDLLIYAKNGWRPGLLEHLAEAYPRHVQVHYGGYRREQLFDAARRSRACAYLADDDHGPLALEEILLAGCPTVGVRTGASLIDDGITGVWVPRLPRAGSARRTTSTTRTSRRTTRPWRGRWGWSGGRCGRRPRRGSRRTGWWTRWWRCWRCAAAGESRRDRAAW
jgi:hypothetical protein